MKKNGLLFFAFALLLLAADSETVRAQGSVSKGPDPVVLKDAELEKEATHNLEVARHYFRLKKAYRAAIARCEEVIAGNPNFARMDEVLFIAGSSSLRLSENRGKQASTLPADKLREDARNYFSQLVNDFPDSPFHSQAEKELRPLGGAKPKDSRQ